MYAALQKSTLPKDQVEQIIQISQRGTQLIASKVASRPTHLFHYTNGDGLIGIAQSGNLHLTHIAFMNDASEYQFAGEMFRELLNTHIATGIEDQRKALWSAMLTRLERFDPIDYPAFFVGCFSETADSLEQWRGYGTGSGRYAVAFDRIALTFRVQRSHAVLVPVVYSPYDQAEILKQIVLDAEVLFTQHYKASESPPLNEFIEQWINAFILCAIGIAPCFKHESFKQEAEWRIIYYPSSREELRFRTGRDTIVPFVALRLAEAQQEHAPALLPIKSITIGPSRSSKLSLPAVRALFERFGYDGQSIEFSRVPYRYD